MSIQFISTIVVLITLLTVAVIAYVKIPAAKRNQWSETKKKVGEEYAPEYSIKEKLRLLMVPLLWLTPFFLVVQLVLLPQLQHNPKLFCIKFIGISGFQWFLMLILLLPLAFLLVLVVTQYFKMRKVLKAGQYPLPGEKVLKPTIIIRGKKARNLAVFKLFVVGAFTAIIFVLTLYLYLAVSNRAFKNLNGNNCQQVHLIKINAV